MAMDEGSPELVRKQIEFVSEDSLIKRLVAKLDFTAIHAYVKQQNWKWQDRESKKEYIPTVEQIKAQAFRLLAHCYPLEPQYNSNVECGGFKVVNFYHGKKSHMLSIVFHDEKWDEFFEELEEESKAIDRCKTKDEVENVAGEILAKSAQRGDPTAVISRACVIVDNGYMLAKYREKMKILYGKNSPV